MAELKKVRDAPWRGASYRHEARKRSAAQNGDPQAERKIGATAIDTFARRGNMQRTFQRFADGLVESVPAAILTSFR